MKLTNYHSRSCRAGFTLVEILVVLVIASILAAITLGGYSALRNNHRRTSCQANMAQIYQAIRLYATDYDGNVPYYNPVTAHQTTIGEGQGLGLWALYTFANNSDSTIPADASIKPDKRYLSNPKLFHCPADGDNDQLYKPNTADAEFDVDFISFQIEDPDSGVYTYNPIRTTDVTELGPNGESVWQRQLLHWNGAKFISRPPTDDTVVLWCSFHRSGSGSGEDNVLFWDGSVQSIPVVQDVAGTSYTDWQRIPKR